MDKAAYCVRIETGPQTHHRCARGPSNILENCQLCNYFFDPPRRSARVCTIATRKNAIAVLRCSASKYSCQCVPKNGYMLRMIDKISGRDKKTISQNVTFCVRAEHLQPCCALEVSAAVTRLTRFSSQGQSPPVNLHLPARGVNHHRIAGDVLAFEHWNKTRNGQNYNAQ